MHQCFLHFIHIRHTHPSFVAQIQQCLIRFHSKRHARRCLIEWRWIEGVDARAGRKKIKKWDWLLDQLASVKQRKSFRARTIHASIMQSLLYRWEVSTVLRTLHIGCLTYWGLCISNISIKLWRSSENDRGHSMPWLCGRDGVLQNCIERRERSEREYFAQSVALTPHVRAQYGQQNLVEQKVWKVVCWVWQFVNWAKKLSDWNQGMSENRSKILVATCRYENAMTAIWSVSTMIYAIWRTVDVYDICDAD